MKKLCALSLLFCIPIHANFIVVNETGHNLRFMKHDFSNSKNAYVYRLAPGDKIELSVSNELTEGNGYSAVYYSSIYENQFEKLRKNPESMLGYYVDYSGPKDKDKDNAGVLEGRTEKVFYTYLENFVSGKNVLDYISVLKNAKEYLPFATITNDPKTNTPVINFPKSLEALKEQIALIKKEKLSATKKVVKEAVPQLPGEEGGIVGLIGEYCAYEE